MIGVVIILSGAALAALAWRWATSSIEGSVRVAIVASLGSAAVAFNVIVPLPNVELTTTVVICTSIALGFRLGASVGIVAVIGTSFVSGVGVWTFFQIMGVVCIAAIAVALSLIMAGRNMCSGSRGIFAMTAVIATAVYDIVVTVPTWLMLSPVPGASLMAQVTTALLIGIPFTLVHMVSTVVLTMLLGPSLTQALERASLRIGSSSLPSKSKVGTVRLPRR